MKIIGIHGKIPNDVLSAARSVRRWTLKENGGTSKQFCEDASLMLAKKLRKKGHHFKIVCGFISLPSNNYGHCWLEKNGIILDVTADQFNEYKHVIFRSIVWVSVYKARAIYYHD